MRGSPDVTARAAGRKLLHVERHPDDGLDQGRQRGADGDRSPATLLEEGQLLPAVFAFEVSGREQRHHHAARLQGFYDGVVPVLAQLEVLLIEERDDHVFRLAAALAHHFMEIRHELLEIGVVVPPGVAQKKVVAHALQLSRSPGRVGPARRLPAPG